MKKRMLSAVLVMIMLFSISAINVPVFAQDDYKAQIDQYLVYEVTDPNVITDEKLFGKWEDDTLLNEPELDYENYPALSSVRNAAMEGDYDLAKEELLEYYRDTFATYTYTVNKINTKSYRLWAEMIMENLYLYDMNSLPLEKHTLTKTPAYYTIDATEELSYVVKKTDHHIMSLIAYDSKKDGYMAQYNTKEAEENKPYIEVVVNGAKRRYEPIGDTTLRSGEYNNTVYGNENVMEVEESYSTIGDSYTHDSYTRRGCMKFDFSDIDATDIVSDAIVHVYGKMTESDNPETPGVQREQMQVFWCNNRPNANWDESTYTWNGVMKDDCFSYDGEYGPNIDLKKQTPNSGDAWSNNLLAASPLTDLYSITGNEAYAYHAIRYMVNAANRLGDNFTQVHHPFFQAATRMNRYLDDIKILVQSEYMTPQNFTIILKLIKKLTDYLVEGWEPYYDTNNQGQICTASLLSAGMTFREFADFSKPTTELKNESSPGSMLGGYLAVGLYRSVYKLTTTIQEDGTSVEVPRGYIGTDFSSFTNPFDYAETVNFNLENTLDDSLKERIRKSFYYAMYISNPITGAWQQGDDDAYDTNWHGLMRCYDKVIDDPVLDWIISYGESGTMPEETSKAYDSVGRAVLRSSWDKNAVAAQINADGGYQSHGHNDDLGLNLMAYGQYLLSDQLSYLYQEQPEVNWQRSTRAHNTVEINDTNSRGAYVNTGTIDEPYDEVLYGAKVLGEVGSLHPENREMNKCYDFMRAETVGYKNNENAKGDFTQYRDILFIKPGYFIVTDYIEPTNTITNKYSQAWHFLPEANITLDSETNITRTNFDTSANLIVAPVEMGDELHSSIKEGLYSRSTNRSVITDADYVAYVKNTEGITTFNTVLYPMRAGDDYQVETQSLLLDEFSQDEANAFRAKVSCDETGEVIDMNYFTLFDLSKKVQADFGNYSTDAELAFVEISSEKYSTAVIRKGKNITSKADGVIVESSSEIEDLGINWTPTTIALSTTKGKEFISTLKIYSSSKISSVTLNGVSVRFVQDGNYVYLGEHTFQNPPGDDTNTDASDKTPQHGVGGGGGGRADSDKNEEEEQPEDTQEKEPVETIFSDTASHWAEDVINSLSKKGIIAGDPDGKFRPDDSISRAEVITLFTRAFSWESGDNEEIFSDVKKNDWFFSAVDAALNGEIISVDDCFRPYDNLSREEISKIICNAAGVQEVPEEFKTAYNDEELISPWAKEYVRIASYLGYMHGRDDGSFAPKDNLTRAETATVLYRMLEENTSMQ